MNEIDTYINSIESKVEQVALNQLRAHIKKLLPDAVECISYGMPAFRVNKKVVAGFAAFKSHLTFFPFSGATLGRMEKELTGYSYTKSGVHFQPEKPLSDELIEKIIRNRLGEIDSSV